MEQAAIAVLGALAAWLSQDGRPRWARWACVVGLIGQPLWIMATWQAQQWGMFALSVVYTAAWIRGIWAHWINPARGRVKGAT